MPDSPQVPGYIDDALRHLPPRPPVHNAVGIMAYFSDHDAEGNGDRTVPPELADTAIKMLNCVASHGDPADHVNGFLNVPGGRDAEDLVSMMQIWITCVAPIWTGPADSDETAYFAFETYDDDGNKVEHDQIPPHELLAARLVTARLSDDRAHFTALVNTALEQDTHYFVSGAVAILDMCARALRDGY